MKIVGARPLTMFDNELEERLMASLVLNKYIHEWVLITCRYKTTLWRSSFSFSIYPLLEIPSSSCCFTIL